MNENQKKVLFTAASIGNHDGLWRGLLIVTQLDINMKNDDGDTLLHCALKYSTCAVGRKKYTVKLLIDFGADPNVQDKDGKTCFDICKEKINSNYSDGRKWISEQHKEIFTIMDTVLIKLEKRNEQLEKKLREIGRQNTQTADTFLYKMGYSRNKLCFNYDKTFSKDSVKNVYEECRTQLFIENKDFLDQLYNSINKELDGNSEIKLCELIKVIRNEESKSLKQMEIINKIAVQNYNKIFKMQTPQSKEVNTLQSICLEKILEDTKLKQRL